MIKSTNIKSTHDLSEKDVEILLDCMDTITEVHCHMRKGVPQTKYVFKISSDSEYYCLDDDVYKPVPEHLKGYWMQAFSGDNTYYCAKSTLRNGDEFVKCQQKKIETYVWEAL